VAVANENDIWEKSASSIWVRVFRGAAAGGNLVIEAMLVWNAEGGKAIDAVTVDPDHVLPDDNRTNNSKKAE
jgi:hypothetical protein